MDVRYARRLSEELLEAFEAVRKIEENSLNAAHGSSISPSESNLIEAVARGGERGGMSGAAGIGVEFGQSRLNAIEHDLRLGTAGCGVVEIQIHSQAPFTRRGGRA